VKLENKSGVLGTQEKKKTPLKYATGILKMILPEKAGYNTRIAKEGVITSVPIYGNIISVSSALVVLNIPIDFLKRIFVLSLYS
jgi:hypothetical protein